MTDDEETGLARSRTHLSNERTFLDWWRTALTSFVVAAAVGQLVPKLAGKQKGVASASAAVGIGFAVLGLFFIAYGLRRFHSVRRAVDEDRYTQPDFRVLAVAGAFGAALGIATIVIVAGSF